MVRSTDPYQPVPCDEQAHSGISTRSPLHQDHSQSSTTPPHLSAYDAQQQQYLPSSNVASENHDIELNTNLHPRRSLPNATPYDLPPSINDEAGPPVYTVEQQLQQLAKKQDAAAENNRSKWFLLVFLNSAILIALLGITVAMFVEGRRFQDLVWPKDVPPRYNWQGRIQTYGISITHPSTAVS